ncbi:hypothetical protein [Pseudaminobacter salicylatoxidans]|uniref:hypothetical protein n=1 Tax=Pseudaminobacter salicylatoxidans TaxID=93369 RepID=UPI00068664A2|nr:hypothetical protein [Pseudaminobacter salicylatoxidans]
MSEQPVEYSVEEAKAAVAETISEDTVQLPQKDHPVSDGDFDEVVHGALDAVGGTLLFTIRIDQTDQPHYAAAAFIGEGEGRQYLVLTMPLTGGHLSVETAAKSKSPIAGIAAAYAGLADAFSHAA